MSEQEKEQKKEEEKKAAPGTERELKEEKAAPETERELKEEKPTPEAERELKEKKENPEPELEFTVKMSTGILYDYMLHHAYTSPVGIIGSCFGVFGLILFAKTQTPLYLLMGLLALFYLPVSLWRRSATLMLGNGAFKHPLAYTFSEKGFSVSQGGEEGSVTWDKCIRAVGTRKSIFIYTGKRNASIFPREQIPGGATALISLLSKYMEPKKVKIRY